jgi:hypothetical protein
MCCVEPSPPRPRRDGKKMLTRTLTGRALFGLRLAPSFACLLRRGYASPAATAADDITIDEESPRAALASSSAAAVAVTVPTVLQPQMLIYDVCHLCHRGEREHDLAHWSFLMRGSFPADWGLSTFDWTHLNLMWNDRLVKLTGALQCRGEVGHQGSGQTSTPRSSSAVSSPRLRSRT